MRDEKHEGAFLFEVGTAYARYSALRQRGDGDDSDLLPTERRAGRQGQEKPNQTSR